MSVQEKRLEKKRLVLEMRRQGHSYKDIIEEFRIAKSTLSDWVKSELSEIEEQQIKLITSKEGRRKIIEFNKTRSLLIKKEEKAEQEIYSKFIKSFQEEELFWLGMGLYMAEGAKTDRWKAIFYNSDTTLNKAMMYFFRVICKVSDDKIHIQLILHENISEEVARQYWSRILNISEDNFYKASYALSSASKGKRPKNRLPYGTVQISVSGKDTANKVRGWTLGIERKVASLRV